MQPTIDIVTAKKEDIAIVIHIVCAGILREHRFPDMSRNYWKKSLTWGYATGRHSQKTLLQRIIEKYFLPKNDLEARIKW